jgi:K(+)-stimulated pyrophosphate-energized sodium pump
LPFSLPLIIGFLLGPEALGGFLAGAYSEWSIDGNVPEPMQEAPGIMQKRVLKKELISTGKMYLKGSEPHKASVTVILSVILLKILQVLP